MNMLSPGALHIMLDIETLGKRADAVVCSIGAVFFTVPEGDEAPTYKTRREFYLQLQLAEQLEQKRQIEPDTLAWWLLQNERASLEIANAITTSTTINFALSAFVEACRAETYMEPGHYFWANGVLFDFGILEHLLMWNNKKIPWNFRSVMDFRTIKNLSTAMGLPLSTADNSHSAIGDARAQAEMLAQYIKHARKLSLHNKGE